MPGMLHCVGFIWSGERGSGEGRGCDGGRRAAQLQQLGVYKHGCLWVNWPVLRVISIGRKGGGGRSQGYVHKKKKKKKETDTDKYSPG